MLSFTFTGTGHVIKVKHPLVLTITKSIVTSSCDHRIVVGSSGGDDQNVRGSNGGKVTGGVNGKNSSGGGGSKSGMLRCPKCGNQCTHVETFVCKC